MTSKERDVYMPPDWRLAFEGIWSDIEVLVTTILELGASDLGPN
jgi:hypothetical protein